MLFAASYHQCSPFEKPAPPRCSLPACPIEGSTSQLTSSLLRMRLWSYKESPEKLRRLKWLYREVEIEEGDYRQEAALAQAKLSGIVNPEHAQIVTLGDNVEVVVAAWEIATKEERRDMLQMMLDAVYIDMATKEVVGLKPKAAFLPLFNLAGPVKAGEVILATNLTAER